MNFRHAAMAALITLIASSSAAFARYHPTQNSVSGCSYSNSGHTICYRSITIRTQVRHRVEARRHHYRRHHVVSIDANGNEARGVVVSHKTGATARVAAAYAPRFQAYIDELEADGASIKFMGGIRRGHCWSGGQHPCGKALDVCQLSRDRVDGRCHLPGRQAMIAIARSHGLQEGGMWCHGDRGHAQVDQSAAACGGGHYASRYYHHRHHYRYARR